MAQHGEDHIMAEQVTLSRADYVHLQAVISSLLEKQQHLEAKINTATLAPISTPMSVPTQYHTPSRPSEPKAAPPDFFTGKASELHLFLTQCQQVFHLQPSKFATEETKVIYMTTYLRGSAYAWVQPHLEQEELPSWMMNIAEFTKKITSIFGDPDQAHTAICHLEDLKQTKSATVYATEFLYYAALVKWNNEALYHLFYKGLKETVKDLMI